MRDLFKNVAVYYGEYTHLDRGFVMATSLGLAPETEQRLDQLASMGSFRSLISSSKIVVVAMKLVRRWA